MVDELSQELKSERFRDELTKYSVCKSDEWIDWDKKIDEWKEIHETGIIRLVEKCICTTPIKNIFYIRNIHNGNVLTIGCECIKRFQFKRLPLYCRSCPRQILTNIDKRREEGKLTCKDCKKEATRLGKMTITTHTPLTPRSLGDPPWVPHKFVHSFKKILTDEKRANILYNDPNPYNFDYLNYFKRYCELLCEITDDPDG